MKRIMMIVCLISLLGGCAAAIAPVTGTLYTNVSGPLTATSNQGKADLIGKATARSILGIFASGDASIAQAAKNGGITQIHHVDYESRVLFGILAEFTVVVYGN